MRTTSRALRALVLPVAVASLVVSGCGGTDDGDVADPGGGRGPEPVPADPGNCPVGAHEEADGVTEVTVWHPYNALTLEAIEDIAAAYNASQDLVRVRVEAQGSYPELLKKFEDSLATPGDLPDVVFSEDTTLQYMIDSLAAIPAADCIAADDEAEEFYGDLLPAVENAYTVDGRLWAAAFGVSMPVMYVNNAHLRAAGLDTEQYPGTLEEVRAAAESIRDAGIEGVEAPLAMMLYAWYPENWLTGAGQEIVDQDNGRAAMATESRFDNEATAEVVGWLDSMAEDGLLNAFPYSSDIPQFLAVGQSTASMLIDGSRAITAVDAITAAAEGPDDLGDELGSLDEDELSGLDVDVAAVPGLRSPGRGAVWGSAAFLLAGDDQARVAGAWDFLRWFNLPDSQTTWLEKGSYLPVTDAAQQDPDVVAFFSDSRAGRWLGVANEQLLSLDPEQSGPVIGPYNEFRSGFHAMLDGVVLGDDDPGEAIASFDARFQAELDRYAEELG